MFETVRDNLLQIQEEIEPCKPKIIAVTKYFGQDAIISAYEAGVRDFGESRAVEACEKISSLPMEIKQNSYIVCITMMEHLTHTHKLHQIQAY